MENLANPNWYWIELGYLWNLESVLGLCSHIPTSWYSFISVKMFRLDCLSISLHFAQTRDNWQYTLLLASINLSYFLLWKREPMKEDLCLLLLVARIYPFGSNRINLSHLWKKSTSDVEWSLKRVRQKFKNFEEDQFLFIISLFLQATTRWWLQRNCVTRIW